MPESKGFLWLDFRRGAVFTPGLFQCLPCRHRGQYLVAPCGTAPLVQAFNPQFVCFELEGMQPGALVLLQQTRLQQPKLPLVVVTVTPSQPLALWVWHPSGSGKWGQALTAMAVGLAQLNAHLEALLHAGLGKACVPGPALLRHGTHAQRAQKTPPGCKTLAAHAFVDTHFAQVVRLAQVADACHMCTSEFSRTFKKENGHTFSEYLLKYRISRACELLSDLSVQVKTVAFAVGFNDLSYFARTFRRYVGTTPSAYQGLAMRQVLCAG